jgi:hypothetical protein
LANKRTNLLAGKKSSLSPVDPWLKFVNASSDSSCFVISGFDRGRPTKEARFSVIESLMAVRSPLHPVEAIFYPAAFLVFVVGFWAWVFFG